jgi:acetyl esterase/lipase
MLSNISGWRILLLPFVIIVSACSPLSLLNSTVDHSGYNSHLDITYGSQPRQPLKADADVVIFYYGGRWQSGNKHEYTFVADAFTSKGIIAVLPDYRLYPEVDWQTIINDAADAYEWVHNNIAHYQGNPQRIFVAGHSAGAHIAAMLVLNDDLLNGSAKPPCGFIGLAGPYDFLPIEQADIKRVFSTSDNLLQTQPITYVSPGDPAIMLLHGEGDTTVKPGNSIRMADMLRLRGGQAEYVLYKDVDHVDILLSLSSTFRDYSPALQDSIEFIQRVDCK